MKYSEVRDKLLEKPGFREEYERYDLAFEIAQLVIELRLKHGITQEELATKIGTKQTAIARLENGNGLPSLSFLNKIAKALGEQLEVRIKDNL